MSHVRLCHRHCLRTGHPCPTPTIFPSAGRDPNTSGRQVSGTVPNRCCKNGEKTNKEEETQRMKTKREAHPKRETKRETKEKQKTCQQSIHNHTRPYTTIHDHTPPPIHNTLPIKVSFRCKYCSLLLASECSGQNKSHRTTSGKPVWLAWTPAAMKEGINL